MNETAWHDLFDQAITLFAKEPQMFQGAVVLGGLVLLALVLEGLSSLLHRRHRLEPEAPAPRESTVESAKAARVAGAVWKRPEKTAPNRKRFLRTIKQVEAHRPKIKYIGSAAVAPAPTIAAVPAKGANAPVAMSDFSQPLRRVH